MSGPPPAEYRALQRRLATGWNTWDNNSMSAFVLLPSGLEIKLGMKHNASSGHDAFLPDTLVGRLNPGSEDVTPGPHSWDGRYTSLDVSWQGHHWRVQSATAHHSLVLLVDPLPSQPSSQLAPTVVISAGFLWNNSGFTVRRRDSIEASSPSGTVRIFCTCTAAGLDGRSPDVPVSGPYFATDLLQPVGISTGAPRSIDAIRRIIADAKLAYNRALPADPASATDADAIETVIGWDTIYEPRGRRVFTPISRIWSMNYGGYVLGEWDTFFAATLAATGDRDLAYANALEELREATPDGIVPNIARTGGWKTTDRSEPPVGAVTVLHLYNQFHDRWFLEAAYPALLKWNLWWSRHRDRHGYLVWGSDPGNLPLNPDDHGRGNRRGAILESGLDNSPMYDDAPFDSVAHQFDFADVGLMSLYVADCKALASIADLLHRPADAVELRTRAARYQSKLNTLWSNEAGIYLNKDLQTGRFSTRLSPTNFYPMLAGAATPAQVDIMVHRHLLNPDEFWGEWTIPSIARNDPAFADQNYWRGRIWGSMNYLVYLGLRNYDQPAVTQAFATKSQALFVREWSTKRHVHENYNGITGLGDDVPNSDRFYHWGALLGLIQTMQQTPQPPSVAPDSGPSR